MGQRLLIVGAGGFGREVLAWARAVEATGATWRIGGFLDDNPSVLAGFDVALDIVGSITSYVPQPSDVFVCAVGDPATRLRICRSLQSRGAQFTNVIHPTAIVGPGVRMGQGVVLCPYTVVTCNVTLGDFVVLNLHAIVGHDARVGDGCTLNGHAEVLGFASLDEGVFLGGHAVVLPSARVGAYARVGAGSVVLRTARAHDTVIGVPAKSLFPTRVAGADRYAAA